MQSLDTFNEHTVHKKSASFIPINVTLCIKTTFVCLKDDARNIIRLYPI